jgi:two-component system response regulator HydG
VALDAVSCLDGLEASLSSAAEAGDGQRGIREHAGPDHAIVSLADMKKHAILRTIRQLNGNKLMAAKLLGIGRTTLYRKLKEYLSPRQ